MGITSFCTYKHMHIYVQVFFQMKTNQKKSSYLDIHFELTLAVPPQETSDHSSSQLSSPNLLKATSGCAQGCRVITALNNALADALVCFLAALKLFLSQKPSQLQTNLLNHLITLLLYPCSLELSHIYDLLTSGKLT